MSWSTGEKVFGLELTPGPGSVDCTFTLHRNRFVEFLTKPEFVTEPNPGP